MTAVTAIRDALEDHDRVYLEKLRLAATAILDLDEDLGIVTDILVTELYIFRDRVDRALLLQSGRGRAAKFRSA